MPTTDLDRLCSDKGRIFTRQKSNDGRDVIRLPPRAAFVDTERVTAEVGYASTLAHELVHWTAPANASIEYQACDNSPRPPDL